MRFRERFYGGRYRWPTCMGENPPRGLPMRKFGFMHPRLSIEVRVWRWDRR